MALLKKSTKSGTKVPYTYEDDIKIMEMSEKEVSAKKIGEQLGRSEHTIRYRQRWLRQSKMSNLKELKAYHDEKVKATK